MKRKLFDWLLLALCVITAVSCSKNKEDIPSAAVVTLRATDVSYCSATLNGKLNVSDELMPVVEFGFEYSEGADISTPTTQVIRTIGVDNKFQCTVTGLKERTEYFYRSYVKYTSTGVTKYGDYKLFTTPAFVIVPSGKENGHDYVDLGLPSGLKWATCNIGASKPEDYGSYFAWGETVGDPYIKGKDEGYSKSFDWSTYKYCNGSSTTMTKYCTNSGDGTVDNKTTLELSDDAARANWGGKWRMPTATEIDELFNNCTWEWTTQNGVYGYRVTSKIPSYTDKSIFLPAAGYRDSDILCDAGSYGYYWSSSLGTNYSYYAYELDFGSDNHYGSGSDRYYGQSVRPVCPSDNYVSVTGVELNTTSLSLEVGGTATLTATVSPSDATDKSVTWESNNTSVAMVDSNGKITAKSAGTATITVTTTDGSKTATCTVTVKSQQSSGGKENGHDYVDLGLPSGVKWATCNIGASKPEEYGSYFAWGETVGDPYIKGKDEGYSKSFDWSTYKYCNGSSTTMTKYCTSSGYGTVDNKTTLELSDDAARANWGGSWRMPTITEIDELLDNCTWVWTTQNGVNGYKVTGKKAGYTNKSVFLPVAGYRNSGNLNNAGSYGYYWSSSLNTYGSYSAYGLYFYSGSHNRNYDSRHYGRSVRPVCP
ncbi:MAG: Ig-like domain-containing protein [Bacteroidaceae bacterium]|nr:Ig-like domain-containing protein [Bacteroidaceae bacterium]